LKELFGPAFGPGVEAYGRSFAECLCEDDALVAEVRDRFERGRAEGSFPALGELLSTMQTRSARTVFSHRMGACSPAPACPAEEPLGPSSVNGNLEAYREDLYSRMTFGLPDLRAFAQERLEELARVGLLWHGGISRAPAQTAGGRPLPPPGRCRCTARHTPCASATRGGSTGRNRRPAVPSAATKPGWPIIGCLPVTVLQPGRYSWYTADKSSPHTPRNIANRQNYRTR
jgi:hypothetical protein